MSIVGCLEVDNALKARSVIGVLASSAKRRILSMLLESAQGLTAKEIAVKLGVSLPTILEHMDNLIDSGLVEVEQRGMGIRGGKVYRIKYECIRISLRLDEYVRGGEALVDELAARYVTEKRRRGVLSSKPQVRDVAKTLNVDRETALMIAARIVSNQDWLVEQLISEALEVLRGGPAGIRDLASKLRVDYALAALVASKLIEDGKAVARDGKLLLQK